MRRKRSKKPVYPVGNTTSSKLSRFIDFVFVHSRVKNLLKCIGKLKVGGAEALLKIWEVSITNIYSLICRSRDPKIRTRVRPRLSTPDLDPTDRGRQSGDKLHRTTGHSPPCRAPTPKNLTQAKHWSHSWIEINFYRRKKSLIFEANGQKYS